MIVFLSSNGFAYEEVTVTNGGTIRGVVKLQGKIPILAPLRVTKAKEICKNVLNETAVVGPAQGVRYAVVTLEGISRGRAVEKEVAHELDNSRCRFVPHVLAVSVGQFLLLKNSDPILHTAHALFRNSQPQFNVAMYPGRSSRKPLVAAGIVKILCEVHPWMSAYIVVTEHPYHAVTDAYGEYEITDVPPGNYRVKVWHELLGEEQKAVEVKGGIATEVNFGLSSASGVKK